jgi:hypothetical protein
LARVLLAAVAACLMAVSAACSGSGTARAAGAPVVPPDGTAYSGVTVRLDGAGLDDFRAASGQREVAILNRYNRAGLTGFRAALGDISEHRVAGMISWRLFRAFHSPKHRGATQASIRRGEIDPYILGRAAEARRYGKPLFIRMNWEMNGDWMPYSRLDAQGRPREGNSYARFRDAWRRTVILFRGGTKVEIDRRLRAQGMPPLKANVEEVAPVTNVAWAWVPASKAPHKGENVHKYYPGDAFVDWVGVDWYGTDGVDAHARRAGLPKGPNEIYDRYSGPASTGKKPFMLGEYGVFGKDRHEWLTDMFDWMESRPNVKAALYFSVPAADQNSRLSDFPLSAQVFRNRIAAPRWIANYGVVTGEVDPPEPVG